MLPLFILYILVVLEILFFTSWRGYYDPHITPIVFFSIQLSIGILPFFIKNTSKNTFNLKNWDISLRIILVVLGTWFSFDILSDLYKKIAINPSYSDIIPLIQKMSKYALSGEYPYTPFDDFGYRLQPTYLPAQWMPYIIAEKFKFDARFISFWFFIIAYIIYAFKITKDKINIWQTIALLAIPILFIHYVVEYDQGIWSVTVEQLIMSYYLIFGLSLTKNNRVFQIIGLVLCLMSRFTLVFWFPLFLFMLFTKDGWQRTFKFAAFVFIGCALLYAPFLIKDPMIFFKGQKAYEAAITMEWTRSEKPLHLYNGLGFAIYFLERGKDIVHQLALIKNYMYIATISVSVILGFIWWRLKEKLDFSLFAICSLKISLTFFYSFIFVPYAYLFVTPIIISIVILYKSISKQQSYVLN